MACKKVSSVISFSCVVDIASCLQRDGGFFRLFFFLKQGFFRLDHMRNAGICYPISLLFVSKWQGRGAQSGLHGTVLWWSRTLKQRYGLSLSRIRPKIYLVLLLRRIAEKLLGLLKWQTQWKGIPIYTVHEIQKYSHKNWTLAQGLLVRYQVAQSQEIGNRLRIGQMTMNADGTLQAENHLV